MTLSRRQFLKVSSALTAGLFVTPTAFVFVNNELNHPVVKSIQVPIHNLPEAFHGFRVVALTDFHLYPYTRPELIRKSVELANALKPDLGVFVGDFVWRNLGAIFDLAPILAGLNAKHGLFSVVGNHDIWLNVDVVKQGLTEAGIPVLVNQGLSITEGKSTINLVGLDDGWSGNADLDAAYEGLPEDTPTILLLHEPDLADQYAPDGRISLQISGHSHGGQVRINDKPFIAPHLGRKYNLGLFHIGDMWLYTSPGVGVISVPLRFNCPPEVTDITLINADSK